MSLRPVEFGPLICGGPNPVNPQKNEKTLK